MRGIQRFFLKLAGRDSHLDEVSSAVSRASDILTRTSLSGPVEVLESLATRPSGLRETEARERLESAGRNEIAHETAPSWYRQLFMAFINPFVGILVVLGLASFVTEYLLAPPGEKDPAAVIIIGVLVLISVLLTFVQEYRANRAADQLLALVQPMATVEREGAGRYRLPTAEIVPGDIVLLSAGDIIPADVRFLSTTNLSLNEAALTGESLPVEKAVDVPRDGTRDGEHPLVGGALDLDNIGFMGTSVVSGTARAVVVSTGTSTYFGSMSEKLVGHHPPSAFDRGVKNVSVLLIRFMLVMVPVIFLISVATRGDWSGALLFGLAVAVGLTPEMLPTIITANLAKGTLEMARRKTIVKRLSAIQNLGAMDVLCTDKTGTLTHDTVALERYVDAGGRTDPGVLRYTYLNSYHQEGFQNPLDEAVLAHPDAAGMTAATDSYIKVAEIPFETSRRRMSVVLRDDSGRLTLVSKGAVEEMVSICSTVATPDGVRPLTPDVRDRVAGTAGALNDDGLRVLVVGYRNLEDEPDRYGVEDERDMVLAGLIGFLDPPKETAGTAIDALKSRGIRVLIITGDNEIATRRVCREIEFPIAGILEGHQVDAMSDEDLRAAAGDHNVFVRTAPLEKSRIVNALKERGHTVGFLGDGINDAPALRDADVGVSVENAVDIAKESADIVLLEKDLTILEEGVARGRLVFGNMMKYIKMTVSSNFGNVFSVLVASIVIPFPPMLPLHLLIQNLLYDISQLSIPWDTMDEEYLARPQRWDPGGIGRFTVFIGPISSIFDFTTFALLWFVFGAGTAGEQAVFQTGWFVLGLLSQTLIVHIIRTRKIPFIQSTAARPVIVMTGLVMITGLILPFTPVGAAVGFVPLPPSYFGWVLLTLLAYSIVMQAVKTWYVRRFDMWL